MSTAFYRSLLGSTGSNQIFVLNSLADLFEPSNLSKESPDRELPIFEPFGALITNHIARKVIQCVTYIVHSMYYIHFGGKKAAFKWRLFESGLCVFGYLLGLLLALSLIRMGLSQNLRRLEIP